MYKRQVIIGAGIDEQHDGKGITISKGIGSDKPHITLSWSQVEKRIGDLIRMDRYLNQKEKEKYPEWLEKQEERRAELAEQRKNREILSTAPPEPENKEEDVYKRQAVIGLFKADETEFTKENALMTATSQKDGSFSTAILETTPFITTEQTIIYTCLLYTYRCV